MPTAVAASFLSSLLFFSPLLSSPSPPSLATLPRLSLSLPPPIILSPFLHPLLLSPKKLLETLFHHFSPHSLSRLRKRMCSLTTQNSGGHAVNGFYFSKELLGSGHNITILTVGQEGSDKMKKPPFNRFSEIVSAGGKTVWGDPAEIGKVLEGATFEVVLDNNGKDLDAMPTDEPPHVEGDIVKADAGHVGVEKYISEIFGNWASFCPQYMIGSGNNKECEECFFDRRPVLIPGSGMQLTSIAHIRDLSSMLTLAVEKPDAASAKIFNCICDRAVTLDGMAKLCAQAAGLLVEIVHYDPNAVGIDAKKAFPFRNMHFYSEPRAAK
ncbi:hypothetical protein Pfo_017540 [Paulownia fortunei]|nr:hypothetical protein Pfo_017540 [Paulownia fortunei]